VEVDKEFLQNFVNMMDTLITMTRDKLVWQNLAIPFLGDDWAQKFEQARSDKRFLAEIELQLAGIQQMRNAGVAMLDQLQKGESIHLPIDRIN
jgi:hypothetical protein